MSLTKRLNFNVRQQKIHPKNVLQPLHDIPVRVRKLYTDVNGVIIDKNTIAANLQVELPVYMLGDFDRQGGYKIGQKVVPPLDGTFLYQIFVNGLTGTPQNILGFTGVSDIQGQIQPGDIVFVYTDSLLAPNVYMWIIIQNNYASISSIIGNSGTTQKDLRIGKLFVYEVNYFVDSQEQLYEDWHYTRADNIGTFRDNQLQPLGMFRTPMDRQQGLITVKTAWDLTQFLGVNFYMVFECNELTLDFKIDRMTNKKLYGLNI